MFYSRELLARKASLGQIWLLGTRQSKLDRKKANKLDIARLCEEILNPPVPIALRLSSILMGGVVILYEKKLMFLHDDANRFLIEIRNSWKEMDEPTLLPKRKAKAKRKSITLPENEGTSMGLTNDGEPEEEFSMGFQQNNLNMQLDQVDDYYITSDPMDDNTTNDHHQAVEDDITLPDLFQPDTNTHGRFERFEEVDEEMQVNFPLDEHNQIFTTPIPSPARQGGAQRAGETQVQQAEHQVDQQFNEIKEARDQQRQGQVKQKRRKPKGIIIDEEQTVISNHVYQSWLQDTSDITSRSGRKKRDRRIVSALKIAKFMELPSTVLMVGMFVKGKQEIPYPEPLLDLWKQNNQSHDSPSVKTSHPQQQPQPQEPSSTEQVHYDCPMDYGFEDLHNTVGSPSYIDPTEIQRTKVNKVMPVVIETPGNSGDALKSIGSSVSGDTVPLDNSEVNVKRVGSKMNNGNLDTLNENFHEADPDYMLTSPKKKNMAPDQEFLVETQLTMETPADDPPIDIITENIKNHLKTHFETPGAPQVESLLNLAAGMNRKKAAQLFYQTCVLSSKGFLKLEQKVPFGDIFISKGAKM